VKQVTPHKNASPRDQLLKANGMGLIQNQLSSVLAVAMLQAADPLAPGRTESPLVNWSNKTKGPQGHPLEAFPPPTFLLRLRLNSKSRRLRVEPRQLHSTPLSVFLCSPDPLLDPETLPTSRSLRGGGCEELLALSRVPPSAAAAPWVASSRASAPPPTGPAISA
jgi:hypothetical protein